jgi:hypothetical protein
MQSEPIDSTGFDLGFGLIFFLIMAVSIGGLIFWVRRPAGRRPSLVGRPALDRAHLTAARRVTKGRAAPRPRPTAPLVPWR